MRRRRAQGFTLMEMLIVIAIIAVLVGIAIPVVSGQLERARQGADLASERSAYAAALSEWMTTDDNGKRTTYYYDNGALKKEVSGIAGYGQSSVDASEFSGDVPAEVSGVPNVNGRANYLAVRIEADGSVAMSWSSMMADWSFLQGKKINNQSGLFYGSDNTSRTEKEAAYNAMRQNSNEDREKADISVLNAIADYFNSLSADEAKAILGESKFNAIQGRDGSSIMQYCVDGSYSIRLNPDKGINSSDYLKAIGYDPQIYVTESGNWHLSSDFSLSSGVNNYVDTYLFSSDAAITGGGNDRNVNLSFKVVDGKITGASAMLSNLNLKSTV